MEYEAVIGLELHAELSTDTKIYCSCQNKFGGEINTHCCPICTGMPGTLPKLNGKVVEYAVKAGLATGCSITQKSKQDRKNYFYPDLPKAYQISQFDKPLCENGYVEIDVDGEKKRIGITRIHIEEDAGKSLHDVVPGKSLMDYNRCGVPLIEIVSEPDMRSAKEAGEYLETLKNILEYINVSDCKMQEGSLRCDVNVSVRPKGQKEYGIRSEMKNVNSFSGAVRGIEYEINRHIEVLENGGTILQETRRWDDANGESVPLRTKEEAHDYRYFPEPDLMPISVSDEYIENIRKEIPMLPAARREKYINEFGLPLYDAQQLTTLRETADFFEETVKCGAAPKAASNWIMGDIWRIMNEKFMLITELKFTPAMLAEMISFIDSGKISNTAAKQVLENMFETGEKPSDLIEKLGLTQVNDENEIVEIVKKVIEENPQSVADYKKGKDNAAKYIIGQVMRASRGKANPQTVNKLVTEEMQKLL